MAGNTTTGHLVQIGASYENDFVCAASVLTPGSGNSNVWLGLNDVVTEMFNSPIGWEWSGTAGPEVLDDGEFYAWAPGEPNNSGEEDVAELRTDGMWTDNKDNATTIRKYVIEWEINSASPIADARQYQVYYTAPFGPGGTWNLYKAVFQGTTFAGAHGIATTTTADSTGIAGVVGNPTNGHLVSVGGQMENDFVFQIMAYSSMGSVNTWLGTDDPASGGTESGFSKTSVWVWAGTSDPWTYEKFSSRPRIAAAINTPASSGEPNNGNGAGKPYAEMTSNSFWNDAVAPSAMGNTCQRYVVEWDIGSATPIAGAATSPPPIIDTTTHNSLIEKPIADFVAAVAGHGPPVSRPGISPAHGSPSATPATTTALSSPDQRSSRTSAGRPHNIADHAGQARPETPARFQQKAKSAQTPHVPALRRAKGGYHEGGLRGPFLAHGPGRIKPNNPCGVPVINLDPDPTMSTPPEALPPQTLTAGACCHFSPEPLIGNAPRSSGTSLAISTSPFPAATPLSAAPTR